MVFGRGVTILAALFWAFRRSGAFVVPVGQVGKVGRSVAALVQIVQHWVDEPQRGFLCTQTFPVPTRDHGGPYGCGRGCAVDKVPAS